MSQSNHNYFLALLSLETVVDTILESLPNETLAIVRNQIFTQLWLRNLEAIQQLDMLLDELERMVMVDNKEYLTSLLEVNKQFRGCL